MNAEPNPRFDRDAALRDAALRDAALGVAGPAIQGPWTRLPPLQHPAAREGQTLAKIRRNAVLDAGVLVGATVLVTLPVADMHQSLLAGIAAASLGLLIFVIRRGNDLEQLARANRKRAAHLSGKGISLKDWHAGVPLDGWAERQGNQSQ
jgi:hypothetical protein